MKINERDALNISKPHSDRLFETQKSGGRSSSVASGPQYSADAIDLGGQGWLAAAALAVGSDQRASRAEQLRELVQSGQYQADARALSHALVRDTINGY